MLHILSSASIKRNKERILENYQKQEAEHSAYIVVPEQATMQMDVWILDELQRESLMDLRVVSFQKLSKEVLESTFGANRPYIDNIGKAMVLRTVFEDFPEEFELYRPVAQRQGFLTKMESLLTELKRNDIQSTALKELANRTDNKLFSQKLKEVSFLQEQMELRLTGHYADSEDKMNMLVNQIVSCGWIQDLDFYFFGFHSFTAIEYRIVEQLIMYAHNVYITLPMEEKESSDTINLFQTTQETVKKLREFAQKSNIPVKVEFEDTNPVLEEFQLLGKNLFDYKNVVYPKETSSVSLTVAKTTEEEVHWICNKICELVQEEGYRYREIGLLVTDIREYGRFIRQIFPMYHIPVFVDEKKDLIHSPAMHAIFSLWDMVSNGFRYEDVFSFLKAGFTSFSQSEIERLENFVLAHKIRGEMYFQEKYFLKGEEPEEERDQILDIRQRFEDMLLPFYRSIKKKGMVEEFAKQSVSFLIEKNFPQKIEEYVEELKESGLEEFADENRQVWNIFVSILEQMVELLGSRMVKATEFRDILYAGIQGHKVGILPPSQDQVIVGTLDRSRTTPTEHLFVLGLHDGMFPKVQKEGSVLEEEERTKLLQYGFHLSSVREKLQAEERLSWYNHITQTKTTIYLSYAEMSYDKKVLYPSFYVDKIRRQFPKMNVIVPKRYDDSMLYSKQAFLQQLSQLTRPVLEESDSLEQEERAFCLHGWDYLKQQQEETLFQSAVSENPSVRYIPQKYVSSLYGSKVYFSASGLEQYARCPYKHFIHRALSPKERARYEMEETDIGILVHGCIDEFTDFLKKHLELSEQWEEKRNQEEINAIFSQYADKMLGVSFEDNARNQYLLRKIRKTTEETAKYVVRHLNAGTFKIWGQEVGFGYGKDYPAVELIEDTAYLRGRIDRVDVCHKDDKDYVKVIDYKTGKKTFHLSDAWQGYDLQLLFYLYALLYSRAIGKDKVYPAGAFYFLAVYSLLSTEEENAENIEKLQTDSWLMEGIALKEEEILKAMDQQIEEKSSVFRGVGRKNTFEKDNLLTQEEFEQILSHSYQLAKNMATEILEGKIQASPTMEKGNRKACDFCRYQSICGFDERKKDCTYRVVKEYSYEQIKAEIEEQIHSSAEKEESHE